MQGLSWRIVGIAYAAPKPNVQMQMTKAISNKLKTLRCGSLWRSLPNTATQKELTQVLHVSQIQLDVL